MQLTSPQPLVEDDWFAPTFQATPAVPPSDVERAIADRRCSACGVANPSFGLGPPLTRAGTMFWACGPHRAEVERTLRRGPTLIDAVQSSLL